MSSSSTFQFAVNLNSQEDHGHDHTHDHDHDHHQDNGGSRPVVDEVDFFAASSKKVKLNLVDGDAESNRPNSPSNNEMDCHVNTGLKLLTTNTSSGQSMVDDTTSSNSDEKRSKYDEVHMLQAELQRVSTENQRLKDMLNQATSNHNDLQLHFMTLVQQQQSDRQKMKIHKEDVVNDVILKSNNNGIASKKLLDLVLSSGKGRAEIDEQLSLSTSDHIGRDRSSSPAINAEVGSIKDWEGTPEDRVRHQWSTHKVASQPSPPKPNTGNVVEPQAAAEATMRKARVSVRARSEAAMITDGCQWRKYGQKMAKGNPCPRAYYRCTMAGGCPVRKQVQRCAEDRGILITTYEGNHNHPLPPAAMAMASTTASAARMLLSGSMPSAEGLVNPNILARALVPCSSSMATISASAPFPTVTLDLTQPPAAGPGSAHVANSSTTATALFPQMFGQALYNNQSKFSGLHASRPQELAYSLNAAALSTGDPDFTAALAAAITSIIGGSGSAPIASGGNNSGGNNIGCDSATINTSNTNNNIK